MVYFVVIVEDFFSSLKLGMFIFFHLRFCNASIILSAFTGNYLFHLKRCCLVAEFTFFLLFWAAISSSSQKSNFPIRLSPKTLAWTFIFEFWVWSFSAAIFFLLMYIMLWALGLLGPITLLVQHTYTCTALYLYRTLMPPI